MKNEESDEEIIETDPESDIEEEDEDVENVEVEASEPEVDASDEEVEGSDEEVEGSDVEAEPSDEEEPEPSDEEAEASDEEADETNRKKKTVKSKTSKKKVNLIAGIEKLAANSKKVPVTQYDSDDEEEEEDVNYLQKFDSKMRENFILDHHPESRTHNYEEVKALSRVSRDGRGIIIDPLHKTIPFLTKYEMTRVIGQRAKQLDHGAKAFVKVPMNVIDGYHIALLELEQKKLPFIIKRPYPNGGVEYWNVSDLELLV
jgi:DNA-directed RNA polymerase I, II, and III subunit RPABC2